MKFLHAADIHLDSPLSGLAAYADAPVSLLRTATRAAFGNLISDAIAEAVDFVIISGDLYDGTWRDFNTGLFFCSEMAKLDRVGIPVYLLYGNHDAESEMTRKLQLPPNVHQFDTRKPQTYELPSLKVALHGRSFKDAATTENLAVGYPDAKPGWLNIGVLHTALEGNSAHANYAPCSLAQLTAKGYVYWALGHVHDYQVVCEAPWVVFAGNVQGRHVRETGPRGAVLVTAEGSEIVSVERRYYDVLRWERLDVQVGDAQTLSDVIRLVGRAMGDLVTNAGHQLPLAVRVRLLGKTSAHGELFGRDVQLRAEVLAQTMVYGAERLWLEKLRVETMPLIDKQAIEARADAVAELQVLLDTATDDPQLLRELIEDLQALVSKAPIELSDMVPQFPAIRQGDVADLVRTIAPTLLAQLAEVK